jgi:hypothetical protein
MTSLNSRQLAWDDYSCDIERGNIYPGIQDKIQDDPDLDDFDKDELLAKIRETHDISS